MEIYNSGETLCYGERTGDNPGLTVPEAVPSISQPPSEAKLALQEEGGVGSVCDCVCVSVYV